MGDRRDRRRDPRARPGARRPRVAPPGATRVDYETHGRDYSRRPLALERPRFGTVEEVGAELGGRVRIESIPTFADCTDCFFEAYWNRPEVLLDPTVRASQSIWQLVEERIIARLAADLESGKWDEEHGALRLVISELS